MFTTAASHEFYSFRPYKDSSLHKFRGLIAACLGSGILGEMWRLLMQGDKSNAYVMFSLITVTFGLSGNYFNSGTKSWHREQPSRCCWPMFSSQLLGAPMLSAQADAFLAAMHPIAAMSMNVTPNALTLVLFLWRFQFSCFWVYNPMHAQWISTAMSSTSFGCFP